MGRPDRTIRHVPDALAPLPLGARKMSGGDRLFLKAGPGATAALPASPQGPPCPGAGLPLLVTEAREDPDPVIAALHAIVIELSAPRPEQPKT